LWPQHDEASKMLENLTISQPQLLASYDKISPNPPLVDEENDHNRSLVNPTLSKHESHESVRNQPLVEKMVDLIPPSFDCTFPMKSGTHTAQIFLIFCFNEPGEILPLQWRKEEIL